MTQLQPPPQETPETALHHGRLGVLGIVFFVVAAAAPLVGMTGAVPVAISLNMSAFMIGMAVAAAVGGVVLDSYGAIMLPMIGGPLVALSLLIWRMVPEGEPERAA